MQVFLLSSLDELAPYAEDWDRLAAGVPFRSWAWLSAWWRHYGPTSGGPRRHARLAVPCVFDHADRLVGVAPWYLDCSGTQGYVLRFLGTEEICSDYLSVLCQPGMQYRVTRALADFLLGAAAGGDHEPIRWDLLELTGVDAADQAVNQLVEHLTRNGSVVHRRAGSNCWRIELPESWDDYLAMLSKSHRKQIRRLERRLLNTGRAVLHTVRRASELPRAAEILVALHQQRRCSLGECGCFDSQQAVDFHREVMPKMLSGGRLQLHWIELDGEPIAAEYHLAGGGVVYAYQSGIDPRQLRVQPGRLATVAALRRAIAQGYQAFDFLCGDEPYKMHFRARPRPSHVIRVVPKQAAARWRHNLWLTGRGVKRWIKTGLSPAGIGRE